MTRRLLSETTAVMFIVLLLFQAAAAFPPDFDGDGKSDLVVYRPSEGNWYVYHSTYQSSQQCPPCFTNLGYGCVQQWGWSASYPVSGDYDGDGKADVTVWANDGIYLHWYISFSSNCGSVDVLHGLNIRNDLVDEGDFDQDGKSDLIVYRKTGTPSVDERTWYVRSSIAPYTVSAYQGGSDYSGIVDPMFTISGNYSSSWNGSRIELARWYPRYYGGQYYGAWIYVFYNFTGIQQELILSPTQVIPLSANFGGASPGLTDFVRWTRGNPATWDIRYNGNVPNPSSQTWGLSTDVPVAGDYDGDGIADYTVWRNDWSSWPGYWFILPSGSCPPWLYHSDGC